MENPWTEFQNNPKQDYLILEADKLVVDKFNETANEKFRIHTEIMPAPFMGNVLEAQVLLLLLNPGYDEEEERKNYYNLYRHYWENEIQHKHSIPDLPLFCLEDSYINFSDYWQKRLNHLIKATSKEKVAKNVAIVQYFPYHSKKFKLIPKRILEDNLVSQKYNFYLIEKAIERNATIIILRGTKLWYKAVPLLEKYENKCFTNSRQNTTLTKINLTTFEDIVEKLNRKDKLNN